MAFGCSHLIETSFSTSLVEAIRVTNIITFKVRFKLDDCII